MNEVVTQSEVYYVQTVQENVSPEISPLWVETAFDIGSFVMSVAEFNEKLAIKRCLTFFISPSKQFSENSLFFGVEILCNASEQALVLFPCFISP